MKDSTKTTIAVAALVCLLTAGVTYGTTKTAIRARCRAIVKRDCSKLLPKQEKFCAKKAEEICDV